jgi:hypothetical protein
LSEPVTVPSVAFRRSIVVDSHFKELLLCIFQKLDSNEFLLEYSCKREFKLATQLSATLLDLLRDLQLVLESSVVKKELALLLDNARAELGEVYTPLT